jgi:hypothetical protein
MKTIQTSIAGLLIAVLTIASGPLSAQRLTGNKNVVSQERTVENFTGINVGGAFAVFYTQKNEVTLMVEADENLLDAITTKVKGDHLHISSSGLRNATKLNIYVTAPELSYINVSGAARFEGQNTLSATNLVVQASGASEIKLDIEVDELAVDASGASDLKISGNAGVSNFSASGASNVKARDLQSGTSTAEASGAANISVNSNQKVFKKTSGAGDVKVFGDPSVEIYDENSSKIRTIRIEEDGSKTKVNAGSLNIEVTDGDSTTIIIGNKTLIVDDEGSVTFKKAKRTKFNGHWGGFTLGINGYVDGDMDINVPDEYDFLDLKYEKSIDVNLNFYEQNFNLINNKLGMITGLGLRWNNYRLADNIQMVPDSAQIFGYPDTGTKWEKSKIVANYLTVPLILEYQTNPYSSTNSFHISAGMLLGWRFRTYTKMMTKEDGRNVSKIKGEDFHMNPFRYDATVRIGWGVINLYGTYSLNALFKDDKGPELYPFAVGISLVGW